MKKKLLSIALILAMVFAFSACGGGGSEDSGSQDSGSESSQKVDSIDLTYDEGNLKYVGFEKAVPELILTDDVDNAYIFIFDFTNYQDASSQPQSVFRIQFFQNGAELTNNASYSSEAAEQYELLQAFFSEALKGGTIHFGVLVVPKDNSPITIQATRNGAEDTVQMMEVDLGSEITADADAFESVGVANIDSMLQGDWVIEEVNIFHFENGVVTVTQDGSEIGSGEYTINNDTSEIDCVLHTDKELTFHLPFKIQDDKLHLYNNHDVEMIHQ